MESRRKALISRHIVLYRASHPLYGLILVEDELIKDVIVVDKSIPVPALMDKYSDWNPVNYEHYYISPGLIDCNVRTNGDWEGYRHLTRAALCGGVTMLLEEPSLYELRSKDSELFCDVGRAFLATSQNISELSSALAEGILAVKGYLSPPNGYVDSVEDALPQVLEVLSRERVPLLLDAAYPSMRHLYMGSPCRFLSLDERMNFEESADSQFFAGAFPDEDRGSSEEEKDDLEMKESPQRTFSDAALSKPRRISGNFDIGGPSSPTRISVNFETVGSPSRLSGNFESTVNPKINIETIDEEAELPTYKLRGMTMAFHPRKRRKASLQKFSNIYQDLDKRIKRTEGNIADLADIEYKDYLDAGETLYLQQDLHRRSSSFAFPVNAEPSPTALTTARASPSVFEESNPTGSFQGRLQGIRPMALSIARATPEHKHEGKERKYLSHLANYPDRWECKGIASISALLASTHCRVHICNLSSANAVNKVRKLKCAHLSCETCPHYLYFTSDEIQDGTTILKTNPPVRNLSNNLLLWDLLKMKAIDIISSNHTPILPRYKFLDSGNFRKAIGGVNGLGFSLQAVWTKLREQCDSEDQKEHYIVRLSKWLSLNPAKLLGVAQTRGAIDKGKFADLVIWQPKENYTVYTSATQYPLMCPYLDHQLFGKVRKVYLRGALVFDEGSLIARGRRLYRNQFIGSL